MLSVDDLHAGKHGGNRGRWMGWVVMQMEKSVTGCRTANSPEHCTLTATSQTKASLLQPPFASSEGEQPQQRTNIKPATTAHQLTAASCCSSSELGISLGNGHHYQLLTAAGDRWYHLRPSACGTVYSGWHSEKLGHGIFTLCWKATETTADWDLSLEYFLNGQETGTWEVWEQEHQYCEVLDVDSELCDGLTFSVDTETINITERSMRRRKRRREQKKVA